jgi:hypothetical protein
LSFGGCVAHALADEVAAMTRASRCLLVLAVCAGCATTAPGSPAGREQAVALFNGRWAIVEASRSSQPLRLLVDTGANQTLIDLGLARTLGPVTACTEVPGALLGALCHVDLGDLTVADRTVKLGSVYAADMARSELGESLEVDGLLGGDALSRFVLVLDYPHSRWALVAPEHFAPPPAAPIPIELVNGAVWLNVTVAGRAGRFLLDTGNGGRTIVLDLPDQEALVPADGMLMPGVIRSGAGGSADATACRAPLEVGAVHISEAPLFVATKQSRQGPVMARAQGILGVGFLRYFRVTVDYPGRKLYLEQQQPFPMASNDATYGVIARPQGGALRVQSVGARGAADAAGIQVGDRIVELNGVPVSSNAPVLWPLLQPSGPDEQLRVTFEGANGGGPRTVTLKATPIP